MGAINEYNDCNLHPVNLGNGHADPVRDDVSLLNNEEFQVHQPPPETDNDKLCQSNSDQDKIEAKDSEDCTIPLTNLKTGLSQSNLSIASSCNSNRDYTYGSQQHYTITNEGYQSSTPTTFAPLVPLPETDNTKDKEHSSAVESSKPIIRSAIYKQESMEKVTQILEEAIALNRVETIPETVIANSVTDSEEKDTVKETEMLNIVTDSNDDEVCKQAIQTIQETKEIVPAISESPSVIFENGIVEKNIETPKNSAIEPPDDGPFDSLINLPEPPSLDEIKLLNEITLCENNNMDSLPPPPLDY